MPGPTFAAGSLTYIADLNTLSNALLTPRKQTGNYTATRGYWDTLTANAIQVTLPASPSAGDLFRLSSGSASVTSVTLLRNGSNIDSTAADRTLTGSDKTVNVWLLYVDASIGWRVIENGGAGGLAWGGVQTAGFTAVKNTMYAIDGSTFNVTMPAAPAAGDMCQFFATTDARNAITFLRNGLNIDSAAVDYVTGTNRFILTFVYVSVGVGWRVLGEDGNVTLSPTISAGTLTLDAKGGRVSKFKVALNANITTLAWSNLPPTGVPYIARLQFTADGTARTVTWGAAVKWPNGTAPTLTSTNTKRDKFTFESDDAGTTIDGAVSGLTY